MQRIFLTVLLCLLLVFNGCYRAAWNKELKGLKAYSKKEFWYEWIGKDIDAIKPQVGEEVCIDYTLQKGSKMLDDSYSSVYPILVQIPEERYDNFFTKSLKLMAEGDSLRVLIPANEVPELLGAFTNYFDDKDLVTFTYKMHSIKDQETLNQEILREQSYLDSIRQTIPTLIPQFKAGTLEHVTKTASGLSYIIYEEGTGAQATINDAVSIHYICFSSTGKIVDDSYTNMVPLSFEIGSQSLIEGWSEGASLLKQGGKAVLFIPPHLAYGSQGNGAAIPPNSLVVFFIEMMGVEKH
jgi:FKBP-type peptidyl-prolyl cis-trans isomerase